MTIVSDSLPVGIIVRRNPGITRWAKWAWHPVAVIPGAGPADWKEMRREGDAVEYHAATLSLDLFSSDTQGYLVALSSKTPSVYAVFRDELNPAARMPWKAELITANAYEGQGYAESGDGLVELVPMPLSLISWVRDFVHAHHVEEDFVKRKRDRTHTDLVEDGKGDPRIRQLSDVYRAPHNSVRGKS
ncbi:Protein of unknown function [Salinihabitans flavidus]|uniref:Molybdopterin-guanine dinucleotide biosynthesis protein A n=1 Tax=Salinihabitans flavidus TaxID=569882 RepID=A0A1H8PS31_9RHOB|nr:DUF3305 domain-containing protein [Salinihabitans flavidus]SEO44832.1 Protein of unknown function [Salinihabitans flavidus]